jgi:uncharacterized protein YegP (UPF0339 family)
MKTTLFALPLAILTLTGCAGGVDMGPGTGDDAIDGKADSAGRASAGRFETFTGKDGQLYFHLLATNGEKVLSSEGYASKQSMLKGLDSVRFNGQLDSSYQLLQSADGQWYFNLLAGNYEVVGTSELYVSKSNAERGLATVVGLVKAAAQAAAPPVARFQLFQGLDGQYYFHLRAENGEIVLQSQAYTRRASALGGTTSVRSNGPTASRYQVRDAANGQAYFVLKAGNGQVIGVSETYASRDNAERAATEVATLLSGTAIIDAQ